MKPTLRTIFDLVQGFDKHEKKPPHGDDVEELGRFYEQDFSRALSKVGSLRINKSRLREIWYFEEVFCGNCLVITERKAQKEAA